MNKKLLKLTIFSLIVYASISLDIIPSGLINELAGAVAAAIILYIADTLLEWDYRTVWIKCLWLRLIKRNVRVSMSYQIKIRHNDRLVLVPVSKGKYWQLVGGKYKYTSKSKSYIDSITQGVDPNFNDTSTRKQDLALMVKPEKVRGFLKWFDSGEGRERDPWREFSEEILQLASTKPIDAHQLLFYKCDTIKTPLRFNEHNKEWEIIHYDVYEIEHLKNSNIDISELLTSAFDNEQIALATNDEATEGCIQGVSKSSPFYKPIAKHARWIMKGKWDSDLEVWEKPKTRCGCRYDKEGLVLADNGGGK